MLCYPKANVFKQSFWLCDNITNTTTFTHFYNKSFLQMMLTADCVATIIKKFNQNKNVEERMKAKRHL